MISCHCLTKDGSMKEARTSGSRNPPKDLLFAAAGFGLLAAILLAYALFGHPAYGFYGVMKWAVFVGCVLSAYALFRVSRWLGPVSACLLFLGFMEIAAHLRREEWLPYNWMTMALLVFASVVLVVAPTRVVRSS
jgi:hypothetical protein